MQFESWADVWAMGGYGFYVWSSFLVSFIALILLVIDSVRSKRQLFKQVLLEVSRKQRIQRSRQQSETISQNGAVNNES